MSYDQSMIDDLFGAGSSAPVGFGGSGFQRNPNIYAFEKKKKRTLPNGSQVNSMRGRLIMPTKSSGLPSSVTVKVHSVKYGANRNFIQICGKSLGEHCEVCSWISNMWDTSRDTGVRASKEDAHKAGKLSLRKDVPGDVWMNIFIEQDLQTPENNGKVFAYRLPAALRDAYNKAVVGGVDAMGNVLDKFDPAHPIHGCSVEVIATYTNDNKVDYSISFKDKGAMFGGNMDQIMYVANAAHDLNAIIRGEANLEKAKSNLEYFLRSYQPSVQAGNTGNAGGFAGAGQYGQPGQAGQPQYGQHPQYGQPFGAPTSENAGFSAPAGFGQHAPNGFSQVPQGGAFTAPIQQAPQAGGFVAPPASQQNGAFTAPAGFGQQAPTQAQAGGFTAPAGFGQPSAPAPQGGAFTAPAGFGAPSAPVGFTPQVPNGGLQQKSGSAFEDLDNL